MADSALTPAEVQLSRELERHGVRYMLVGMSAGLLQGARELTQSFI